ncbi:hypothetical protein MMC08_005827 [Hypocenomyce scalaris]|nr:hypothetical protein [Hypocenomyce scalaris]
MSSPRVIIIGAGLGGLAFAQALRKQHISFQIFERDVSPQGRPQGWAISLHWILRDLLSSTIRDVPPVQSCSVTQPLGIGSSLAFFDPYSAEKLKEVGGDPGDPEFFIRVNRAQFRDWLTEHLPIQWGKKFSHYEDYEDGVTVFFEDGTSVKGDMLIGVDGIGSHVRGQLLGVDGPKLNIFPLACLIGEVALSRAQYERQLKLAHSAYACHGNGFRFFAGVKSIATNRESARYYWMLSWDDPTVLDHSNHWTLTATQAEGLEFALEKIEGMNECFTELVTLTKAEDMVNPPVAVRDMIPEDLPLGRVSLLGDAVHPMTFFRGQGANHAMQDGLSLARLMNDEIALSEGLLGKALDVPQLLKKYEGEMLARTREAVLSSRKAALDSVKGPAMLTATQNWSARQSN